MFKRVIASSGGRGIADVSDWGKVGSQINISAQEVFTLTEKFQHRSHIFRATGGIHSAALCDKGGVLVFAEDVGRTMLSTKFSVNAS